MKILITGGTGRVGANLAQALLDKGHEIRSFVYPGDQSRAHKLDGFDRVETIEGDLRNLADVRRAVEGVDAVYHIAAAFGGPFDNREYLEINGMGTINVLESIRELTPNLHRSSLCLHRGDLLGATPITAAALKSQSAKTKSPATRRCPIS